MHYLCLNFSLHTDLHFFSAHYSRVRMVAVVMTVIVTVSMVVVALVLTGVMIVLLNVVSVVIF